MTFMALYNSFSAAPIFEDQILDPVKSKNIN